jgi:LAO/AO transport system kinase
MEVGDVYVVNKSDLPGADEMVVNLLAMARDSKGRDPSVLKVSATKGEGVDSAVGVLERLRSRFLESNSELGEEIRLRSIRGMITELARRRVLVDLEGRTDSKVEALAEEVMKRKLTVDEAADSLLGGKERRRESRGRRAR